jgi:hypothetical protein
MRAPKVQTPQVVSDLYRDLKDRRLLPVVAALLVAIVAVPVAISASSEEPPPPSDPAAEIVPADAAEAQAAVLAENPGLRNYKRRLDALKAKNPFEQQFQLPEVGETGVVTTTETETVSGSGSASAEAVVPADLATAGGTGSSGDTGSSASGSPSPDTTEVGSDTTSSEPKVKFFTWRLDLRYGPEGAAQRQRNVKVLDLLSPVGVFLGASFNAKKAYFFLSSDIVSATGNGKCQPAPANCEFLVLEEGQAQQLVHQAPDAPAPTTYTLELEEIKVVEVANPVKTAE